jgi:hypothetical protein
MKNSAKLSPARNTSAARMASRKIGKNYHPTHSR